MTTRPSDTSAARAEALGEALTFVFDGVDYEIPAASEWDLDVLESYEDGKIAATCRALLGPEQWATFRSKRRTVGDLGALFEAVQSASGVQGN